MSRMHTLLQSHLRPTRLMQESNHRFHLLTGKAVPPLTQLLMDRGFEALLFFIWWVLHWLLH
ncbi:hypothetical protein Arash_gp170 [Salmonella phage Arash]|nr:hypothetical protein Arash_gp170 [Salmonella phage Arash]